MLVLLGTLGGSLCCLRVHARWKAHQFARELLLLASCLPLAAYCLSETAAGQNYGCTPLLQGYESTDLLHLDEGTCYYCVTSTSTPCLRVPPQGQLIDNSTNTKTVWQPTTQSGQQPVLDLGDQVQSIWVQPGALLMTNAVVCRCDTNYVCGGGWRPCYCCCPALRGSPRCDE